jgi:large subunit ribosomal protein L11
MSKEIQAVIKLQVPGGAANPAPPIGPALGQHGINIQDFCTRFNAATQDRRGETVPTIITLYADRTFDFITKTAPASQLILKTLGIKKGSQNPSKESAGTITQAQLEEVAAKKLPDLNTDDIKQAAKIIAGTARQMGLEIVE